MNIIRESELLKKIEEKGLIAEKVHGLSFKNTILLDCTLEHFLEKASSIIGDKELNWNKEVYYTYNYYSVPKINVDESLSMDSNFEDTGKEDRDAYNATVDKLDLTEPRSLTLAFDSDDILYVYNIYNNWIEYEAANNPDLARVLAVLSAGN